MEKTLFNKKLQKFLTVRYGAKLNAIAAQYNMNIKFRVETELLRFEDSVPSTIIESRWKGITNISNTIFMDVHIKDKDKDLPETLRKEMVRVLKYIKTCVCHHSIGPLAEYQTFVVIFLKGKQVYIGRPDSWRKVWLHFVTYCHWIKRKPHY